MATHIVNQHGLPEEFVRAVQVDKHRNTGDISVTQLIDAPQIRYLRRFNDITEDAMDRMWALFGTAVHHILERSKVEETEHRALVSALTVMQELAIGDPTNAPLLELRDKFLAFVRTHVPEMNDHILTEYNLNVTIDNYVISGTADYFDTREGFLKDYKVCSVYNYIYPEARKKWDAQQNSYAYMFRENGYQVNGAFIVAIFRDWSRNGKLKNRDYPAHQVMEIPIELIDHGRMHAWLSKRVELHKQADLDNVAPCTPKERWAKPDTWAMEVPGGKRALKLFTEEVLADQYIAENQIKYAGLMKNLRPGESTRCDKYCPVRDVCPQRKEALELLNR